MALGMDGVSREEWREEMLVAKRTGWVGKTRSAEVRLLYVSCLCFIVAEYVANDRPWNNGFRMVALVAMIAAQVVGYWARRS